MLGLIVNVVNRSKSRAPALAFAIHRYSVEGPTPAGAGSLCSAFVVFGSWLTPVF